MYPWESLVLYIWEICTYFSMTLNLSWVRCETTINQSIIGDRFSRLMCGEKQVIQNARVVWGNPLLNQFVPLWNSSPKFPPLLKGNFHQSCLLIEPLLPPPSLPLTSFHLSGNSICGPICGAGQAQLVWKSRCHFYPPAFSWRRVEVYILTVSWWHSSRSTFFPLVAIHVML